MQQPKRLLVEGKDDLAVVVHLMKHHVHWPQDEKQRPVFIEMARSADEILDEPFLRVKLKESGLQTLGMVIDSDDKLDARWKRVQQLFKPTFPAMPQQMPKDGLITDNEDGLRLGVWFMPDCVSPGMLETFLRFLVPSHHEAVALWQYAEAAFVEAKRRNCPCRPTHDDKARIHTWLAWQDPPGERLGLALTRKILDPHAPYAAPFVAWFKRLYDL